MSINRVWIMEGCTACGLCRDLCPEVIKINGKAMVVEGVNYSEFENLIKGTAECCPVEAIKYSDRTYLLSGILWVVSRN